jgi:hypothetical protein
MTKLEEIARMIDPEIWAEFDRGVKFEWIARERLDKSLDAAKRVYKGIVAAILTEQAVDEA